MLAAAIYDSVSPDKRRVAHRQLAEHAVDPETRARHLALAADGPDEAVAAELDAAAEHTAARGASAAAADLARLALEATPEVAARGPGTANAHARPPPPRRRRVRSFARGARSVRRLVGGRRPARRALRDLGYCLWYEGERDAGYRLVLDALEHARDETLAARTHAAAAWLWHDNDLDRGIAHADAAVALLDPDEQPGPYSWSLLLAAYLRLLNGDGDDEAAYQRGRELQQRAIDWDDTSPVLGMWPVLHDRFSEARTFYEVGLERSRSEGDVTSVQGTLVRLAEIACWTGDWDDADRVADECMALADRTSTIGAARQLALRPWPRGRAPWATGRSSRHRRGDRRCVRRDHSGSARSLAPRFRRAVPGRPGEADLEYTRAQAIVDAQGQREPARYRFQPDHVEAVVELGDLSACTRTAREAGAASGRLSPAVDPGDERALPRTARSRRRSS